jgi:hypothetical protein
VPALSEPSPTQRAPGALNITTRFPADRVIPKQEVPSTMSKAPPVSDNEPGEGRPRDPLTHTGFKRPTHPSQLGHDVDDPSKDRRGENRDRFVDHQRSVEKERGYGRTTKR